MCETSRQILTEVQGVYDWIEEQIAGTEGTCAACGTCCDFEAYGHRLYVTTPEILYFLSRISSEMRFMTEGICPYREEGRCGVYPFRFAACRIFCCKSPPRQQYQISEEAVRRFKVICQKYDLPYRYLDLKYALGHPELWMA